MLNAYANMSVPPTSRVVRRIEPPPRGRFVVGYGAVLPPGFAKRRHTPAVRWLENRFRVFRDAIEGAAVPRKYAVVPSLRGEERPRFSDGLPTVFCEDPDLVMAVVGRIAGQLYVPLRPVRVRPEALDLWYLFDRADFPSVR